MTKAELEARVKELETELGLRTPQWQDDQLAYDGSSRPQSRMLTPRERDVLTKVLNGFKYRMLQISDYKPGDENIRFDITTLDMADFQWMRLELSEIMPLIQLAEVLDPREH